MKKNSLKYGMEDFAVKLVTKENFG